MNGAPNFIEPQRFDDPAAALEMVRSIYDDSVAYLRESLRRFVAGEDPGSRYRAWYPMVRIRTETVARADSRLSYGFVSGPGTYETTLTRPDLFADYYREQFRLLMKNHQVSLEIGSGSQPLPVHFSVAENDHIEGQLSPERRRLMRDLFDFPDLGAMDDGIANGTCDPRPGADGVIRHPLSLFTAPRVDYSLHRLRHYTGTAAEHFQNFVLFTNYQFYIDEFIKLGHALMADASGAHDYAAFVEPGNVLSRRAGLAEIRDDAQRADKVPACGVGVAGDQRRQAGGRRSQHSGQRILDRQACCRRQLHFIEHPAIDVRRRLLVCHDIAGADDLEERLGPLSEAGLQETVQA